MDEIVKDFLIEGNENESNQNESNQNLDRLDRELGEAGEWAFLEKNYGPALCGRSTPFHAIQGSCRRCPDWVRVPTCRMKPAAWFGICRVFVARAPGWADRVWPPAPIGAEIIRSPAMPIAARTHAGDGLTLG